VNSRGYFNSVNIHFFVGVKRLEKRRKGEGIKKQTGKGKKRGAGVEKKDGMVAKTNDRMYPEGTNVGEKGGN